MRGLAAIVAAIVSLVIGGHVAAQDVAIDYAKDMDFQSVKTFQYVPPKETGSESPLMAKRIVELLEGKLTDRGLRETKENPDLYVTYHLTTEQEPALNTADLEYGGYGPGWGTWGGGNADHRRLQTLRQETGVARDRRDLSRKYTDKAEQANRENPR